MSEPIYGKTPEGQEPDIVKRMSAMMAGQGNGQQDQMIQITKIYADFKWGLKTKDHTHQEIADALQNCITRCENELKPSPLRADAIKRFQVLKQRIEEFIVLPDANAMCPRCKTLPFFICPCPKE